MPSLLNPVVGLLMLRGVVTGPEPVAARTRRVRGAGDTLAGPDVRPVARAPAPAGPGPTVVRPHRGTTTRPAPSSRTAWGRAVTAGRCGSPRRGGPVAQPHCVSVGQKEDSALVSGSRTRAGGRAAGPVARIAYSVPSADSNRWSTTWRAPRSASS